MRILHALVLDVFAADEAACLFEGVANRIDVSGSYGDAAAAIEAAEVVVSARLEVGRHSGIPMETRGPVADWEARSGRMTLYGSTKVPHHKRHELAIDLGLDEQQIRLLALTAGGAFGIKGEVYPEDVLIPWASKQLARPVGWIEDRREHLVAANHSRQQTHDATIAATSDGRILALTTRFRLDAGAYVRTVGVRLTELTIGSIPGPYDIPNYDATGSFVLTNKTPTGTYRSPGGFEASFVCVRMIDLLAERLGRDPIEVRRLNLLRPEQMPYERPLRSVADHIVLDRADYRATLDRVIDAANREAVIARRGAGERVGLGVGAYIEKSGPGPRETASVAIDGSGAVTARSGCGSSPPPRRGRTASASRRSRRIGRTRPRSPTVPSRRSCRSTLRWAPSASSGSCSATTSAAP